MQQKKTVVVLGAGYGGLRVALDCAKDYRVRVILIDKNPYHALPTHFYEVGTLFAREPKGRQVAWEEFHKFFYSAAIPVQTIIGHIPSIEFREGIVDSIDPDKKTVLLRGDHPVRYDYLVVALGSQSNYFNIPHLESNAVGFKSVEEALNVRNRIDELFARTPKHKKITIVVGGGGVTGCELSGELVGYMRKLSELHGHPHGNWSCVLLEAGPALLGAASPWAQKKAAARLRRLGVTVLTSSLVVDVWPNLLYIGKERRPFHFDLLVWTAGVKGACETDLIKGIGREKRNCILVDSYLRVGGRSDVFVVGDIAASADPKTGVPLAMTAQKAIHEGAYVAKVIRSLVRDDGVRLEPCPPKHSDYIIPIGGKYAILETSRIHGAGGWVWVLKYIVLFRYLITILPLYKVIQLIGRELRLYSKND